MALNTRKLVGVGLVAVVVAGGTFVAVNRERSEAPGTRAFLECAEAAFEEVTRTITWKGENLVTPSEHTLATWPFGQGTREMTLRRLQGTRVSVELLSNPSGDFVFHPKLEIVLTGCTQEQIESNDWKIYRLDANGDLDGDPLKTKIRNGVASTNIKHNSKYAIAD